MKPGSRVLGIAALTAVVFFAGQVLAKPVEI